MNLKAVAKTTFVEKNLGEFFLFSKFLLNEKGLFFEAMVSEIFSFNEKLRCYERLEIS